jgi:hypothetical protein
MGKRGCGAKEGKMIDVNMNVCFVPKADVDNVEIC